MKILYLASSADFHVDLWVKYFKENNKVFCFQTQKLFTRSKVSKCRINKISWTF